MRRKFDGEYTLTYDEAYEIFVALLCVIELPEARTYCDRFVKAQHYTARPRFQTQLDHAVKKK